jgi:hypothetical protein
MVRAVPATWSAFYSTDLQACWALLPVPALYLAWRLVSRPRTAGALPAAAAFVDAYAVTFAIETMLDPLTTGPLLRALGLTDGAAGTAVMIGFVLIGDFRVYLLLFALLAIADGRSWRAGLPTAIAWTLLVPLIAYPLSVGVRTLRPDADPNTIWLLYEVLFVLVALALRAILVPRRVAGDQPALRGFLREALAYVVLYYGLWGFADALIQLGGLDVGWLLRVLPNQLYYAFWIPFVVFRFFARR